jgi:Flp pilus assembly protein TadD
MRYAEAADNFVRAADLEPENVASAASAGHALHDAGRNSEAESYFRRALKLEPHEASNLVNLGAVLHVQGNFQEAHAIYLQALRLEPNHQLATTNLRRLQSTWSKKNPSTSVCVTCRHQPARNRTSNG